MIGPDGLQLPSNLPPTQSPSFSFMRGVGKLDVRIMFAELHTECSQAGSEIASQGL
jgi:hypothetical protein